MLKQAFHTSRFVCKTCETEIPLPRFSGKMWEVHHTKDIWCFKCQCIQKHNEVRYMDYDQEKIQRQINGGDNMKRREIKKMHETMMNTLALTGFQAELTMENLYDMEELIDRDFPEGHDPLGSTVFVLGLHLGEVLVHNIDGARWKIHDRHKPFGWEITIARKGQSMIRVKPIARVSKYWNNREETIAGFAQLISNQAQGKFDELTDGDWTDIGDGTMVRMTRVDIKKEYTNTELQQLSFKMGRKVTQQDIKEWRKIYQSQES